MDCSQALSIPLMCCYYGAVVPPVSELDYPIVPLAFRSLEVLCFKVYLPTFVTFVYLAPVEPFYTFGAAG
jgi:hypothetical protein